MLPALGGWLRTLADTTMLGIGLLHVVTLAWWLSAAPASAKSEGTRLPSALPRILAGANTTRRFLDLMRKAAFLLAPWLRRLGSHPSSLPCGPAPLVAAVGEEHPRINGQPFGIGRQKEAARLAGDERLPLILAISNTPRTHAAYFASIASSLARARNVIAFNFCRVTPHKAAASADVRPCRCR